MILQRSSKVGPPQTSQAGVAFGSMKGGVADFVACILSHIMRSEEKCLSHDQTGAFRSSKATIAAFRPGAPVTPPPG